MPDTCTCPAPDRTFWHYRPSRTHESMHLSYSLQISLIDRFQASKTVKCSVGLMAWWLAGQTLIDRSVQFSIRIDIQWRLMSPPRRHGRSLTKHIAKWDPQNLPINVYEQEKKTSKIVELSGQEEREKTSPSKADRKKDKKKLVPLFGTKMPTVNWSTFLSRPTLLTMLVFREE